MGQGWINQTTTDGMPRSIIHLDWQFCLFHMAVSQSIVVVEDIIFSTQKDARDCQGPLATIQYVLIFSWLDPCSMLVVSRLDSHAFWCIFMCSSAFSELTSKISSRQQVFLNREDAALWFPKCDQLCVLSKIHNLVGWYLVTASCFANLAVINLNPHCLA